MFLSLLIKKRIHPDGGRKERSLIQGGSEPRREIDSLMGPQAMKGGTAYSRGGVPSLKGKSLLREDIPFPAEKKIRFPKRKKGRLSFP